MNNNNVDRLDASSSSTSTTQYNVNEKRGRKEKQLEKEYTNYYIISI